MRGNVTYVMLFPKQIAFPIENLFPAEPIYVATWGEGGARDKSSQL